MACRKAADRALMRVGEWLEEQRAEADKKYKAMVKEQRELWRPDLDTAAFEEKYCARWLARGHEVPGGGGCSGGCGKAHPRVVLDWQNAGPTTNAPATAADTSSNSENNPKVDGGGKNHALVTISHSLKPFQNHFDKLVQKGKATLVEIPATIYNAQQNLLKNESTSRSYQVSDFLPTLLEKLKHHFPKHKHLIKVASHEALAASTNAHRKRLLEEQEEQAAKKLRTRGPAAEAGLLEQALQICYNFSLLEHLNVAEIACLRCTSRVMRRIAEPMVMKRMEQLQLSFSVLVDGQRRTATDGARRRAKEKGLVVISESDEYTMERYFPYRSEKYLEAMLRNDEKAESGILSYQPKELSESGWCLTNVNDDNGENRVQRTGYDIVRLFLNPNTANNTLPFLPERDCLFNKYQHLEVARFRVPTPVLGRPRVENGICSIASPQLSGALTCDVTFQSNPKSDEEQTSKVCIQNIQLGFQDLLGVFVRKQLPIARHKLAELRQKRPPLKQEKDAVKLLARMARKSPGSAQAFVGLEGW